MTCKCFEERVTQPRMFRQNCESDAHVQAVYNFEVHLTMNWMFEHLRVVRRAHLASTYSSFRSSQCMIRECLNHPNYGTMPVVSYTYAKSKITARSKVQKLVVDRLQCCTCTTYLRAFSLQVRCADEFCIAHRCCERRNEVDMFSLSAFKSTCVVRSERKRAHPCIERWTQMSRCENKSGANMGICKSLSYTG